jgi:carboxyl-terminal processing protease
MKSFTRNAFILLTGILLGSSLMLSDVLAKRDENVSIPFDDLRLFTEIFARIKNDYVKEISDRELLEQAISGMVSGLDPHSAFLDEEAFKDMQIGTSGQFGGLGIEVGMEDGFIKVIAPIDDTPAQRAGVKAGDLVIRLDEKSVKGMSLTEAVKEMRGKPGTEITLTIVREKEDKPLKITIVRDIIKVKSVKSRILEDGYAYVRITQFQATTGEDMEKAINKLLKKSGGKLKGLVLDLRNNPGGVLGAAVSVSDAFIEKGLIVYTEGRSHESEIKFNASSGDILKRAPMVVLVNGGSASASEIVAGALQDHKRAVIMGDKTFGKGSVQTIIPMQNDTAVKLTTALYFTPNGRSIQAEGIVPDIALENVKVVAKSDSEIEGLKEADLSGHLSNGNGKKKAAGIKSEKKDDLSLASKDYPLYEALNLLKGMNMLHIRMSRQP